MEEFKIRHEVEGRGGLRAAPPDPPPEHGGILKPVCLRDAAQGQKNVNILKGKKRRKYIFPTSLFRESLHSSGV